MASGDPTMHRGKGREGTRWDPEGGAWASRGVEARGIEHGQTLSSNWPAVRHHIGPGHPDPLSWLGLRL